ncbi:MAG: glycoside hydrolase family 172 protein [Promethearchaeota archaeon]
MKIGRLSLHDIAKIRPDSLKRRRISSSDKTGGNIDSVTIKPGEKRVIATDEGAGCITHIWCTLACRARYYLRNVIIRMYWDGEPDDKPSVEVPIGDFFGMGHAKHKSFVSLPLQMNPRNGRGFNCWWPMPYSKGFKMTIENDSTKKVIIYYYIDYEIYEEGFDNDSDYGRFHAQWHRENPPNVKQVDTESGKKFKTTKPIKFMFSGKNQEPLKYNYKILEARGKGHYVGCHLDIDNITFMPWFLNWPGEGDDMIFIDEDIEKKVPTLYGTGTEDYVNQAWSQSTKYHAPYHGTILPGGFNWWGKITYYRYHIEDPIYFNKEIIVSIEHGHDNHRKDDWSSTSYWYQIEPHDHNLYPKLLNREERKPRSHANHMIRKLLCIISSLSILILILVYYFWLI